MSASRTNATVNSPSDKDKYLLTLDLCLEGIGRWRVRKTSEAVPFKRMKANTIETNSSHVIMPSQPDVVIDVIRKAAAAVLKR